MSNTNINPDMDESHLSSILVSEAHVASNLQKLLVSFGHSDLSASLLTIGAMVSEAITDAASGICQQMEGNAP